jgi:hypothetical protein
VHRPIPESTTEIQAAIEAVTEAVIEAEQQR